jgi:uncharacterized BrkB/YihY/UPF0761 family membrane protein
VKTTVAAAREKADATYKRVEATRPDHPTVDIAFSTVENDLERGGGLLAGALAYRFFFWVLPFVLVLVGGLGLLSSVSSSAPQDVAKQVGFLGLTAQSISNASHSAEKTRFWALLVGLPALYLTSVAFVKALAITHGLIWGRPVRKFTYKKPVAAGAMTAVLVTGFALIALETRVREASEGPGIIVVVLFSLVAAGLWLWVSWQLPHGDVTVLQLVPGAILVSVGLQAVHVVTVYYVARKVSSSSAAYGGLGAATAILLSLFFIGRVIVLGAELNSELARRREVRAAAQVAEAEAAAPESGPVSFDPGST